MADPAISQVVVSRDNRNQPQAWLTFTVPEGFDLFVQIGIPVLPRLKDFRPALALIGPGLPKDPAPFPLPDGMGSLIFPTKEVQNPRFFHEHFTGTDSWILRSETVRLKTGGALFPCGLFRRKIKRESYGWQWVPENLLARWIFTVPGVAEEGPCLPRGP